MRWSHSSRAAGSAQELAEARQELAGGERAAMLDDEELQRVYMWVDEIPLSRPKRSIARDFADGVLVAEIVHHYFPKISSCITTPGQWLRAEDLQLVRIERPSCPPHGSAHQAATPRSPPSQ